MKTIMMNVRIANLSLTNYVDLWKGATLRRFDD